MVKTENDIILLDFSDPINPFVDRCGNYWESMGDVEIIWDKETNKYVAQFDGSGPLVLDAIISLDGSKDFTVDGTFYVDESNEDYSGDPKRIFNFRQEDEEGRFTLSKAEYDFTYYIYASEFVDYNLAGLNEYKNKWFHFAVVYNHSTQDLSLYLNGYRQASLTTSIPEIEYIYTCIGGCIFNSENNIIGKLGWFRYTTAILYNTQRFDTSKLVVNNNYYFDLVRAIKDTSNDSGYNTPTYTCYKFM